MKLLSILLLLLLVSCNQNPGCENQSKSAQNENSATPSDQACSVTVTDEKKDEPEKKDEVTAEIPDERSDIPDEAFLFDARVAFSNFERADEEKVHRALDIIREVIRTRDFKEKVINFTYNGQKKFVDTNLTNQQVYEKLLAASEELIPGVDHEMDLELELYYSSRNVVGYTYPNVLKIWMNTKYFDVYTPAQVAGNIFHEWTHKLGFEHDFRNTPGREASVPYALGYLIRDMGKVFE